MGISPEAVRNRVSRGTLKSVKEGGTVYVLLEGDRLRSTGDIPSDRPVDISQEILEEMRGRIEDLRTQLEAEREANRENRRIIAALTSRIPELPPPAQETLWESPQAPETAAEESAGERPRESSEEPQERTGRPSWLLVAVLVVLLVLSFAALGYFGVLLFGG